MDLELSATNAMIPTVNDMIRKQLYGDNPNQIEVGDLLMGYDNVTMNDGEAQAEIIRNSIDYKVASVSNKISKQIISVINGSVIAEVEGYEVTLVNAMDNETVSDKVFVLDNNTSTGAKFDTDTQQQLKYVAVSRARQNVYIVTDNKLNNPVVIASSEEQSTNEHRVDNSAISKLAELGKQRKNECNR